MCIFGNDKNKVLKMKNLQILRALMWASLRTMCNIPDSEKISERAESQNSSSVALIVGAESCTVL